MRVCVQSIIGVARVVPWKYVLWGDMVCYRRTKKSLRCWLEAVLAANLVEHRCLFRFLDERILQKGLERVGLLEQRAQLYIHLYIYM